MRAAAIAASLTGEVPKVGILLGLLVVVSAFLLTGYYVSRANETYDVLTQQIIQETIQ